MDINSFKRKIIILNGFILILIGIIHLAVTPILRKWLLDILSTQIYSVLSPAFFINHIVLGEVFLILGVIVIYSGMMIKHQSNFSFISLVSGIGVLSAVPVLFMEVPNEYLSKPAFMLPVFLTIFVGIVLTYTSYLIFKQAKKID